MRLDPILLLRRTRPLIAAGVPNVDAQWRNEEGEWTDMPEQKATLPTAEVVESGQEVHERQRVRKDDAAWKAKQADYRRRSKEARETGGRKPRAITRKPLAPVPAKEPVNPADLKAPPAFKPAGRKAHNEVPDGFRKATLEEFRQLTSRNTYAGAHVKVDPQTGKMTRAQLIKPDGTEPKWMYDVPHHLTKEREKWARIERLRPHMARTEAAFREGMTSGDDTDTALLLSLLTGMRPSSEGTSSTVKDARGREKKVPTYGSSTLRAKHVARQNGDGSVTLDFIGKAGARNVIKVTDPELTAELMHRKNNLGPNDQLFPEATEKMMNDRLSEVAGNDFSVKDLRTMHANVLTVQFMKGIIEKRGRTPKSQTEFVEWMEDASEMAAKRLGNTHKAFKDNYLSALPFMGLFPDPDNWEQYWEWGQKMKDPDKLFSVRAITAAGDSEPLTEAEWQEVYEKVTDEMPPLNEMIREWIDSRGIIGLTPDEAPAEQDDPDDPYFAG